MVRRLEQQPSRPPPLQASLLPQPLQVGTILATSAVQAMEVVEDILARLLVRDGLQRVCAVVSASIGKAGCHDTDFRSLGGGGKGGCAGKGGRMRKWVCTALISLSPPRCHGAHWWNGTVMLAEPLGGQTVQERES